jgi:hypothetical protein
MPRLPRPVAGGTRSKPGIEAGREACPRSARSSQSRRPGPRIPRIRPPGLRVFAASPEYLLAVKVLAVRPRDARDIATHKTLGQLIELLKLHTVAYVLALVQDVFPEEGSLARLRLLLEDIFDQSN